MFDAFDRDRRSGKATLRVRDARTRLAEFTRGTTTASTTVRCSAANSSDNTMAQQTTLDDWARDPVVDPEVRAHVYSLVNAVRPSLSQLPSLFDIADSI